MIDSVILDEAMENSNGEEIFAVHDFDDGEWTAFERRSDGEPMALLTRTTRKRAIADGKAWVKYKANPVRCCGRDIPMWEEKRCLCCGEDYVGR